MRSSTTPERSAARPQKGDWAAIADKLLEIETRVTPILASIKADLDLQKELEKEVREEYDTKDANTTYRIDGEHALLIIEPKQREGFIPQDLKPKLIRRLGREVFTSLWKISQAALKKAGLTEDELKKFIAMERTGYRPLKVVEKPETKAA